MRELIYKQDAKDAVDIALDTIDHVPEWVYDILLNSLDKVPSAQPETPPYIAEIESEYKKWVSMPPINKPLAKALYEVWKKHDREDVSRNG